MTGWEQGAYADAPTRKKGAPTSTDAPFPSPVYFYGPQHLYPHSPEQLRDLGYAPVALLLGRSISAPGGPLLFLRSSQNLSLTTTESVAADEKVFQDAITHCRDARDCAIEFERRVCNAVH